jgi:hypothetical protein
MNNRANVIPAKKYAKETLLETPEGDIFELDYYDENTMMYWGWLSTHNATEVGPGAIFRCYTPEVFHSFSYRAELKD